MKRRNFIKTIGMASAGMPFWMGIVPENLWGAIPSGIKITGVGTFVVGNINCIIKIKTNEGITGLGEVSNTDGMVLALEAMVKASEGHLIGKDPTNIEFLSQGLYRWNRWHVGALFAAMMSGIDMALWDILGKLADMPVYKLLGGAARDKIRLYCGGSGKSGVERARSIGYNAMKGGPGVVRTDANGKRYVPMPWDLKRAVKDIEEARIAGGDDFDILTDCHGAMDPDMALEYCKAIEPYRVFWAEEPIQIEGTNDALEWLSNHTTQPLCMGERNFMKWGVVDMINKRIVSYINADLARCGGISEFKKIAAMAEAQYIKVSPHVVNSKIGHLASLHCAMNCPNSVILEMGQWANEPFLKTKDWWTDDLFKGHRFQIKDGFATLPNTPGLGIEMNEEVAKAHPYDPNKPPMRPESLFEDGSVNGN